MLSKSYKFSSKADEDEELNNVSCAKVTETAKEEGRTVCFIMAEPVLALLNSLEKATHLTKCLPSATTQDQVSAVYSALREAQQNIQNFLLLNQQEEEEAVATMDENNEDFLREQEMQEDDQPMPAIEDDAVQRLQESIQYIGLQSKRRKREHSPSSFDGSSGNPMDLHYLKGQGQVQGQGQEPQGPAFKPQDNQRKFDLIFQFHG